jgi:hypothetical protein
MPTNRAENSDGLGRNAVGAGRYVAGAPLAADDRGFARWNGWHEAQYRRTKGEVIHSHAIIKPCVFRSVLAVITAFLLLLAPTPRRGPGETRATGSSPTSPGTTSTRPRVKTAAIPGRQRSGVHLHLGGRHPQRRPETGPWHYVDIPPDSGDTSRKTALTTTAWWPGSTSLPGSWAIRQPFAARSEALKFLVHFVGDLSQPLHAMADARGGNDIPVTVLVRLSVATTAVQFAQRLG